MTVQEFRQELDRLEAGGRLQFILPDATRVPGKYHITEVRDGRMRSTDCGGNQTDWRETVIQLMGSGSGEAMETSRAQSILTRVFNEWGEHYDTSTPLYFEYDGGSPSLARYAVEGMRMSGDDIFVMLGHLASVCRPAARGACCG